MGELDVTVQGGLMSMAFAPGGDHLYVNYTQDGVNRVVAHEVDAAGSVTATGLEILSVEQPFDIHNFGGLVFGSDGHLYIGSGDGGSAGGAPDTRRDGQNLSKLFGGILRIAPDPMAGGYTVPPDNPFVSDPAAKDELWVYGLRNPWRFSFDEATGDLWIGDVGQFCWEEVSRVPVAAAPGTNFGWSGYEGFHVAVDEPPDGHVLPIHEYRRGVGDDGVVQGAVIGGYVYRGAAIPDLVGAYVYADWCAQEVRTLRPLSDGSVQHDVLVTGPARIQALGLDHDGELLVLDATTVHRLVPSG